MIFIQILRHKNNNSDVISPIPYIMVNYILRIYLTKLKPSNCCIILLNQKNALTRKEQYIDLSCYLQHIFYITTYIDVIHYWEEQFCEKRKIIIFISLANSMQFFNKAIIIIILLNMLSIIILQLSTIQVLYELKFTKTHKD